MISGDRGVDQAQCGQIPDPVEGVRPGFTLLRGERIVRSVFAQRGVRITGREEFPDDVLPDGRGPAATTGDLLVVLLDVLRPVAEVEVTAGHRQHVDSLDLLRLRTEPGGVGTTVAPDHANRGVLPAGREGAAVHVEPVLLDRRGLRRVDEDACVPHSGVSGDLTPLDQRIGEVHALG